MALIGYQGTLSFIGCGPAILNSLKIDNDTDDIMRLMAETIQSVAPCPDRPWHQRIVLGCWAVGPPTFL